MMKKLLISICALIALMGLSSQAMAADDSLWIHVKAGANTAVEWAIEKSQQGWDAGKEGASHLAAWAGKKAGSAWGLTKQGAHKAAVWTTEKSKQGWHATRQHITSAASPLKHQSRAEKSPGLHRMKGMSA